MPARVDGQPLGGRGPSAVATVKLHCWRVVGEPLTVKSSHCSMDDGEALDWLKISEMTPKLKTKAACRSHTFVCGCLWAVTSSGTYVCGCVRMSIAIVPPSHYTLMSEPAAAVDEKQTDQPPPVWSHSGPGLASSSCVVTVSPSSTAFHGASRPDRSPPSQLPSVDPCLIVMRPRVQQKSPRKAGTSTCARLISGLALFWTSSAGRG